MKTKPDPVTAGEVKLEPPIVIVDDRRLDPKTHATIYSKLSSRR